MGAGARREAAAGERKERRMSTEISRPRPALVAGNKIAGIIPSTIEEVFRMAQAIATSGLAPNGMKTPEQITVAILHGLEIGLPPMQAVQKIAVVNGRPSVWGDAIPALLQARGFALRERMEGEGDSRVAVCQVERPDGSRIERRFSVEQAKVAKLWAKPGPWMQYPDRMLQMRARGFAARDGAADVLSGLYLREELEVADARDITPAPAAIEPPDPDAQPVAAVKPAPATEAADGSDADPIADPNGLVEHIRQQIKDAPADERSEVWESNLELMSRLPKAMRVDLENYYQDVTG
jgi:hypothetical protein